MHSVTKGVGETEASDTRFDYGSLQPSVARFLRGQADRIRRHCASSIIQIGKALHESKRHLSHGSFLRWVESEIGIPARTAQAYMRVATWASSKGTTVAHLPPTALYLLSTANFPECFASEVLKRAEAGEFVSPSDLRKELKSIQEKNKKQHSQKESCAREVHSEGIRWEAASTENRTRFAMADLVDTLAATLSPDTFAYVRTILTNEFVLSDPTLGENLRLAFERRVKEQIGLSGSRGVVDPQQPVT